MTVGGSTLSLAAGALAVEAVAGYPGILFRAIRHPVMWIGAAIGWADRGLNEGRSRRLRGVVALLAVIAAATTPAGLLQAYVAWPILAVLACPFLAQRSLHDHVAAVGLGLRRGGLQGGRAAVAHIVGRNPDRLDEAGVVRAAIESLAENFSDGVVAPAFWAAIAGLPGIVAYKAINTADSMIGHRTPRHEQFGWAAARLDDLVNLPCSRLAALWVVLAACLQPGASPRAAIRAVFRDANHHRSPNAGWPEAAMAGALGLRLAGPRVYGETMVEDGWMGDGRAALTPDDLDRALALYRRACAVQFAVLVLLAVIARG